VMSTTWLRYVPPTVMATLSTVAIGFATEALMGGDRPWWWWLALVGGIVGLVVSGVWGFRLQGSAAPPSGPGPVGTSQRNAGGAQQVSGEKGKNIAISADRGGTAAWQISGGVTMRGPNSGTGGGSSTP
jgi:hypothetical protein